MAFSLDRSLVNEPDTSFTGWFGRWIINSTRFVMGVLLVIWTFMSISPLIKAFQQSLQWGDIGSLITIIYNCLMGLYLFPIVLTDFFYSHTRDTFYMGMSNCLYLIFFLSNLFATIIFTKVPITYSNQNSIDIRNMLSTYMIFDYILLGSLAYPFCIFCVTLNSYGYKRTFFGNGASHILATV